MRRALASAAACVCQLQQQQQQQQHLALQSLQWLVAAVPPTWRRSLASSPPSAAARRAEDPLPDSSDTYYWVPPQEEQGAFRISSIAQRRATGRLEHALEAVLLGDGLLREALVARHGFTVHRVQLSRDRRTVFVLWDAMPGQAKACQAALQRNAFRLRRDLAKLTGAKHTPYLEFRHDHLPAHQAAVVETMQAVEQQEAAEAAAGAAGAAAADKGAAAPDEVEAAADSSTPPADDLEAAISRLRTVTRPVQRPQ